MRINQILSLICLLGAPSISLGFTANRTGWDLVIPQLNPQPRASVEVLMKSTQVKSIDDVLKSSEEKKPLEHVNVTKSENPLQERRFHDVESHSENQKNLFIELITDSVPRIIRQENIGKTPENESNKSGPLNVILLLLDGLDEDEKHMQMSVENTEPFPIQGHLQGCSDDSEDLYFIEKKSNCDCDDLLRSNVFSLLSWAHHIKEMLTSTLYEMPPAYSRRVEMDTGGMLNPRVRRIDRPLHDSWQLNEARRRKLSELANSPPGGQFNRPEGTWQMTDILSRLREAFFRTLLNSLGTRPEALYKRTGRRSLARSSDYHELASRTLEDLVSMPNKRGYLLLAAAEAEELHGVLELLPRYISPMNTLVVVSGTCPRDKSSHVPYLARGPGAEHLADLRYLHEIPGAIQAALNKCRESAFVSCVDGVAVSNGYHHNEDGTGSPQHKPNRGFSGLMPIYDDEVEVAPAPARTVRDNKPENEIVTEKSPEMETSVKEETEKIVDTKKPEESKALPVKTVEKRNENTKIKEKSTDVTKNQQQMEDETAAKNSHQMNSPSTIIFVTIVTLTITRTSKV